MKWLSKLLSLVVAVSIFCAASIPFTVDAKSVHVKGYFRKDGTYVSPHYRTSPDSSKSNNWSYCGNTNPYTGKTGTVDCNGFTWKSSNSPNLPNSSSNRDKVYNYTPLSSSGSKKVTSTEKNTKTTIASTHKGTFTIGSSKNDVIKVMGEPDEKGYASFTYGFSLVFFDSYGSVSGWSNIGDTKLKANLGDKKQGAKPFTIGSTKQSVIEVMGTPDDVSHDSFTYGYSLVFFGFDDMVSGWSNIGDMKLKATLGQKKPEAKGFNVGSTLQEVINAMGTPDSVDSYSLTYGYSLVFLSDGTVTSYTDISNNLKIKTK